MAKTPSRVVARSFAQVSKEFRSLPRADKSIAELLRDAMRVVTRVVPADGWAVFTFDPATLLVTGGVHENRLSPEARRVLYESEYGADDPPRFSSLSRELTPVALLGDATKGDLKKSKRYREALAPAGYEHELRASARSAKHTWGGVMLLRGATAPNFVTEEESFMREVADALGDAIRATLRATNTATDARTGRALLLLGQNQELLAASPAAPVWLEELAGDGPKDPSGVPHTVRSTVNGARRGAERGGQVSAHVRVRGTSGQWLTVHATVLGDGQALVTIEDGRPIAIAQSVLAAYGLTQLEGEVLRDVLHAADEAQIVERLGITPDAAQTSIASALGKVGVSTRDELPKKLFFERYFERVERDEPLGPDGFFAAT